MDIQLTEVASDKVKEIRLSENMGEELLLRVKVTGGGCSGFLFGLEFDKQQDGDIVLETMDVKLVVDRMSIMYLDGVTIDYIDGLSGAGFKFLGGSITNVCGCGQSFSA